MNIVSSRSSRPTSIQALQSSTTPLDEEVGDRVSLSGKQRPSFQQVAEVGFAGMVGAFAGSLPVVGAVHSFSGALTYRRKNPELATAAMIGTIANLAGTYALANGNTAGALIGLGLSAASVSSLMLAPC
jgi:hypothetical protein